jgi:hypothetical protein
MLPSLNPTVRLSLVLLILTTPRVLSTTEVSTTLEGDIFELSRLDEVPYIDTPLDAAATAKLLASSISNAEQFALPSRVLRGCGKD